MEMQNSFTVPADIATAWDVLMDVPRIAPCMPGAELTEVVDESHFKGNAKLRVGPVQLRFAGEAELTDVDPEARTARVSAKGNDTKGRGAAQADVTFSLVEEGASTRVDINTDLNLTGSVAQYGRAAGLINEIAAQIIAEFAKNLEGQLSPAAPADGTVPADADAPAAAPVADNSISGISLFFRALGAMIRRWFGGGRAS
ncbi:MAG: SRPBCC family protein [Alphaproteobacteria bacterium]|nr:SRPBCC family protein [Alphaproteobacteria bacterium]